MFHIVAHVPFDDRPYRSFGPGPRVRYATVFALWLLGFIGLGGLHRMRCGRWISGVIWLCTFSWCGLGLLIDLFMLDALVSDANARVLARTLVPMDWPRAR